MTDQIRIYLASPYSHPDRLVKSLRYTRAVEAAAYLTSQGHHVFAPIAASHPVAECHELPGDFEYWRAWNYSFIDRWATHLYILAIPGWDDSKGVCGEYDRAKGLHLGLCLMHPAEEGYLIDEIEYPSTETLKGRMFKAA